MKKLSVTFAVLFAAMLVFFAPRAYAADILFLDDAELFDEGQKLVITKLMKETAEETGWNIGVVTSKTDHSSEHSACVAAEKIYDETFGASSDGVLYLCDIGYRYIVIANGSRNYISGPRFDHMLTEVNDKYMDYDDMGSVKAFLNRTKSCYEKGEGSSDAGVGVYALASVLAVVAFIITIAAIKSHYSSYEKPTTSNYMEKGSLNIYQRTDQYLRQTVTTVRHSSSSGGGGGGGHHGGGGAGGHR